MHSLMRYKIGFIFFITVWAVDVSTPNFWCHGSSYLPLFFRLLYALALLNIYKNGYCLLAGL